MLADAPTGAPVLKYATAEACPDAAKHTEHPPGYVEFSDWRDRKAKTHDQERCPTCGFWAMWKRRKVTP